MSEKLLLRSPADADGVQATYAVTVPDGMTRDELFMLIAANMEPGEPLPTPLASAEV